MSSEGKYKCPFYDDGCKFSTDDFEVYEYHIHGLHHTYVSRKEEKQYKTAHPCRKHRKDGCTNLCTAFLRYGNKLVCGWKCPEGKKECDDSCKYCSGGLSSYDCRYISNLYNWNFINTNSIYFDDRVIARLTPEELKEFNFVKKVFQIEQRFRQITEEIEREQKAKAGVPIDE